MSMVLALEKDFTCKGKFLIKRNVQLLSAGYKLGFFKF